MKPTKYNQGFTLLETLASIAILSLVLISLLSYFSWNARSYLKVRANWEVLNNANQALQTITYEVKQANGIYLPTTTSTQISLVTESNLPDGETYSYVDIYQCGSGLCIKKESTDPTALTSSNVEVYDVNFTLISTPAAPSVRINFSARYTQLHNTPQYGADLDFSTTAALRDY